MTDLAPSRQRAGSSTTLARDSALVKEASTNPTMSALSPALPPPPGQEANFAHPESLERWTIVCVALCLTIGTVLSCLRCYIRFCIKRSWILEDCKNICLRRVAEQVC